MNPEALIVALSLPLTSSCPNYNDRTTNTNADYL